MLAVGASFSSGADRTALNAITGSAERENAFQRQAADAADSRAGQTARDGKSKEANGIEVVGGDADRGVKAYEAAAAKLAAQSGGPTQGTAADTSDPQVAAELAQLKASDAAVRAHEAAHVAAGGSYVRGGASFTYQKGPDGQQYAVGGEVAIDTSPVAGDPQATIAKMATVRAAALAPADPSAADRAVAAAASRQEAAARLELLQQVSEGNAAESETGAEPVGATDTEAKADATGLQDTGAEQIAGVVAQQVRATYGAFNGGRETEGEPLFQAAA